MDYGIQHRYICVEGPIGVGKTTLTHLLAKDLNAQTFLEEFEDNPFLQSFYEDPKSVAFQTQVYFLMARYKQQANLRQPDLFSQRVVSDYLFSKDRIFAYLNLAPEELKLYDKIYDMVCEQILKPDLVIYLSARVETLMERIQQRGRQYEANVDPSYLDELMGLYNNFFNHYTDTPILLVDSTTMNFQEDPKHYDLLMKTVASITEGTHYLDPSSLS